MLSKPQTDFERRLDEVVRRPFVDNSHLTRAIETADETLHKPIDLEKFCRAILVSKMHARKQQFKPDKHWIWMQKYLEKSVIIAQNLSDLEDEYYDPELTVQFTKWSSEVRCHFERRCFAALLVAAHERNHNLVSHTGLQELLERVVATKKKPQAPEREDVKLMNEALHLIDDEDGDHAALKPYLDKIEQLFKLGLLIDFNLVGPTKKVTTQPCPDEQKDDEDIDEYRSKEGHISADVTLTEHSREVITECQINGDVTLTDLSVDTIDKFPLNQREPLKNQDVLVDQETDALPKDGDRCQSNLKEKLIRQLKGSKRRKKHKVLADISAQYCFEFKMNPIERNVKFTSQNVFNASSYHRMIRQLVSIMCDLRNRITELRQYLPKNACLVPLLKIFQKIFNYTIIQGPLKRMC